MFCPQASRINRKSKMSRHCQHLLWRLVCGTSPYFSISAGVSRWWIHFWTFPLNLLLYLVETIFRAGLVQSLWGSALFQVVETHKATPGMDWPLNWVYLAGLWRAGAESFSEASLIFRGAGLNPWTRIGPGTLWRHCMCMTEWLWTSPGYTTDINRQFETS